MEHDGAARWNVATNGIRIFRFSNDLADLIADALETALLYRGLLEPTVDAFTANINAFFFNTYTGIVPGLARRSGGNAVGIDLPPDYIESGDAIALFRLDGEDPFLGWTEGLSASHCAIAMRNASGHLHVCESTTVMPYWPRNGIQCTEWSLWLRQYSAGGELGVLVPLAPRVRASFNATAAWSFFAEVDGLDYGFPNMYMEWIDTVNDNYPCLPPDFMTCIKSEHAELLVYLGDAAGPSGASFRQTLNHRVNTTGLSILEVARIAASQGKSLSQLMTVVERDDWRYNISRQHPGKKGKEWVQGRSLVCATFLCSMWKAAGVFASIGNAIECTEQDVWDVFSMQLFDSDKMNDGRPEVCKKHDPSNSLCQLMGDYTLHLGSAVNTRPIYKNMGNHCPSQNPAYYRPPTC
jgi:hypothetical protein